MSTKIINVLKDDRFDELLDIFKNSSVEEVIFVLPKKHQALSNKTDFEILSTSSQEHGRSVLILSSNADIKNLALQYNFDVLAGSKNQIQSDKIKSTRGEKINLDPDPKSQPTKEVNTDANTEHNDLSNDETRWEDEGGTPTTFEKFQDDVINGFSAQEVNYNNDLEPKTELVAVKRQIKNVSDIIELPKKGDNKVNVSKKIGPPLNVEIKKQEKRVLDEIESVWQSRPKDNFGRKEKFPKKLLSFHKPEFDFFSIKNKILAFFVLGVVLIFSVVVYISTGSAYISIKPTAHELNLSLKISATDQLADVNLESRRIPGQLFSIEKKLEESFQSTGFRDVAQKAKGKIMVYNEYGTVPQVLVATTRFESANGLIFRTLKTVTVPAMTIKNGQPSPGKIEVEVISDKTGEIYNIGPDRFTIPAFKERGDTARYEKYYGVSSEQMKGGIIGQAKVVTSEDYINAAKQISDKLVSGIENELAMQSSNLKLLNDSKPFLMDLASSAQPDEATDTFTLTQTAKLETVGFKETDLYDLIPRYIDNTENLMTLPDKLKLNFKDISFNSESKNLEFTVLIQGFAYGKINKDKMVSELVNKRENEIVNYIKSIEGVDSAKVVLSPFWVRKVPENKEKINIEFQY